MYLILYFLLAHFLADYPLQPGKLVELKMKRYLGVFIHGLIHLGVLILLLFPFLEDYKVWIGIGVVYVTHNLIDQCKVQLDKKKPAYHRLLYFLDQFLHWSVIAGVTIYISLIIPENEQGWMAWWLNSALVWYLLTLVLVTYFYDVSRYFMTSRLKKGAYVRDYKTMLRNAAIVTVGFGVYGIFY